MNQNPFEDEAVDQAHDAGESWSEGFDDEALASDEANGLEDDALDDDGLDADGYDDEDGFEEDGADGLEDDGFAEEAFADADEGDAYEAGALDAADGLDDMDDEDAFDDGADGADELEEAFADAMDAQDDDEFVRRLSSRMRARLRRAARPFLRRMAARAVPIGLALIRHVSRLRMSGESRVDAMDAFADAAADEAVSRAQMALYIPFLAGLAGRYVTRAILSAQGSRVRPRASRAIGRAVARATRRAAQAIVRRHGPAAIRSIPRLVRQVARVARQQGGGARALPTMIQRAARRVAASRPAAARLSRPSSVVRRVVARAGIGGGRRAVRPGAAPPRMRRGGGLPGRTSTIHVHGPVRIVTRQAAVSPRRPL